jgi:hypothetical protein
VEHRRESRLKISKEVTVRVADPMRGPSTRQSINARVVDVSGSGIRLELALPVPCGTQIEIEDDHTLILGEALRCDPQGDLYVVAIRVSETTLVADAGRARTRARS